MSAVELRHYASDELAFDRAHVYTFPFNGKPRGFWVSALGEDDWPSWCQREEFGTDRLVIEHKVTIAPGARILTLSSPTELLAFDAEYGETELRWRSRSIRWAALEDHYDGILIAPHQWSVRHDLLWYSSWDCASGCIWNLDAIEAVTALGAFQSAAVSA